MSFLLSRISCSFQGEIHSSHSREMGCHGPGWSTKIIPNEQKILKFLWVSGIFSESVQIVRTSLGVLLFVRGDKALHHEQGIWKPFICQEKL